MAFRCVRKEAGARVCGDGEEAGDGKGLLRRCFARRGRHRVGKGHYSAGSYPATSQYDCYDSCSKRLEVWPRT